MSRSKTAPALCAMTFAMASFSLFAQGPSAVGQLPPGPTTLESLHLTCSDFRLNHDGSWSPLHPLQIADAAIGPRSTLRAGTDVAGYDLAAMLNKVCR
jgi:hypothetical protein